MHETAHDLTRVQQLLDESYQAAGTHLREVITPERTLTAVKLAEILIGMRLLVLATVTKDCRPIAGPVDGIFYRGGLLFWIIARLDSLLSHQAWVVRQRDPSTERRTVRHRA